MEVSMAENKFSATAESLFKGMSNFINTKTVVGEPQQIGDAMLAWEPWGQLAPGVSSLKALKPLPA